MVKQRNARAGGDKSGGFRTIILFRAGAQAFFVHGFAKNEQDNIRDDELAAFRLLAARLLVYDDAALAHAIAAGVLMEHSAGLLDKQTMRRFDDACLTPVRPLTPQEIRALREREGASQAVFARYLNVSTGLVSLWERGEKHPQGSSLKLLSLVARHGLGTAA